MADVTMPQLGETVTEGTITRWFKSVGDLVALDEVLFEVSTDKVDSEVPSPVAGVLTEIRVAEGDIAEVGTVLAVVGDSVGAPAPPVEAPPVSPALEATASPIPPVAAIVAPEVAAPTPKMASSGARIEVTMPQLGETVTEGTITRWFKSVGDLVALDEVLFEVSTDKVDSEVPSPVAGVLTEIRVAEGDIAEVGTVLAVVGDSVGAPAPPVEAPPVSPALEATASPIPPVAAIVAPDEVPVDAVATARGDDLPLSPVVRRLISQSGIDATTITGSGLGGRITRGDVEREITAQGLSTSGPTTPEAPVALAPSAAPTPAGVSAEPQAPVAAAPIKVSPAVAPMPARPTIDGDRRVPMNNIRRLTGQYMVASKQTSPHVLTAVEVDFEGVEKVRAAHRAEWKGEEGFSLTYLPFIARALVDSLREYPHINASVGDNELILHDQVNLAIAVDLDFQGLLAPVVKQADTKRLRALSREINDLASRARSKKLSADEITGGTFTITNPGQYGTLMQFPLINQPQVAILSTDGIRRKPVVVTDAGGNEAIGIHSVGILALAWDHRAFDGAYVAAFLDHLRRVIETRDWETEFP